MAITRKTFAVLALCATTGILMAAAPSFAATGGGDGGAELGPTTGPAAEGRRLWLKLNCSGCHGARDEGGGMAPSIRDEADDIRGAVLGGESEGMPSYSGLKGITPTRVQFGYLTAYLQSIGGPSEPRFIQWWKTNPVR